MHDRNDIIKKLKLISDFKSINENEDGLVYNEITMRQIVGLKKLIEELYSSSVPDRLIFESLEVVLSGLLKKRIEDQRSLTSLEDNLIDAFDYDPRPSVRPGF